MENPAPSRVGLLLLPGSSAAEVAVVRGVLGDAPAVGVGPIVQVLVGLPDVRARDAGAVFRPDLMLEEVPAFDMLVVFGGESGAAERYPEAVRNLLAAALSAAPEVMVVGGAHFGMARQGFLAGLTLALPWHLAQRYLTRYPDHRYSDRVYARSGKWWSVSGGVAVGDAILSWFATRFGAEPANALAARWMFSRPRASEERQPVPIGAGAGPAVDPKVARTVALMEANLEEPLTTDQIAERIGVSRRQLERLFKRYLEAVPSQYYLELRLQRARQLLRATRQSIVQIGLACGFASGPHFSSAYRNRFGMTPREDRLRGDGDAQTVAPPTVAPPE